jgi:hypothetical protein
VDARQPDEPVVAHTDERMSYRAVARRRPRSSVRGDVLTSIDGHPASAVVTHDYGLEVSGVRFATPDAAAKARRRADGTVDATTVAALQMAIAEAQCTVCHRVPDRHTLHFHGHPKHEHVGVSTTSRLVRLDASVGDRRPPARLHAVGRVGAPPAPFLQCSPRPTACSSALVEKAPGGPGAGVMRADGVPSYAISAPTPRTVMIMAPSMASSGHTHFR